MLLEHGKRAVLVAGTAEAERSLGFALMAWVEPAYSRGAVNRAGDTYIDPAASPEDRELALVVLNNWRSSHGFPLNTLQVNLRKRSVHVDADPTVAQRIKRLPSIRHKLERFPGMELSRMQDLGGCRAVLSSVDGVQQIVDYYMHESRIKHKLVRDDNYIASPKPSGYRGVHLVYRYISDKSTAWNGLKIEIQVRSRLQHAWATAVETVGTFTQQALKSSQGSEGWLTFFSLMSSTLAVREDTPKVPGAPVGSELKHELRGLAKSLNVVDRLTAYGEALRYAEELDARGHTFLLELEAGADGSTLTVRSYASTVQATEDYSALERAIEDEPDKDVVLVSVESLASLRRAYPNYFLDTTAFVDAVQEAIA